MSAGSGARNGRHRLAYGPRGVVDFEGRGPSQAAPRSQGTRRRRRGRSHVYSNRLTPAWRQWASLVGRGDVGSRSRWCTRSKWFPLHGREHGTVVVAPLQVPSSPSSSHRWPLLRLACLPVPASVCVALSNAVCTSSLVWRPRAVVLTAVPTRRCLSARCASPARVIARDTPFCTLVDHTRTALPALPHPFNLCRRPEASKPPCRSPHTVPRIADVRRNGTS